MTEDEMLAAIRERLLSMPWGQVAIKTAEVQPNGWVRVEFDNGAALGITVEEL